jgi:hypothetical protein
VPTSSSSGATGSLAGTARVFLSFAHSGESIARELAEMLREQGVDVVNADIAPGDSLAESIGRAVQSADYFVPIISSGYTQSGWTSYELAAALGARDGRELRGIVPILADQHAEVPMLLRPFKYVDYTIGDDRYENVKHLADGLLKGRSSSLKKGLAEELLERANFEEKLLLFEQVAQSRQRNHQLYRFLKAGVVATSLLGCIAALVTVFVASPSSNWLTIVLSVTIGSFVAFTFDMLRDYVAARTRLHRRERGSISND